MPLYLDHCATTPPHPEVIEAITDCMGKFYGNPSSIHRIGLDAERLLVRARGVIAEALGCRPGEILFTSGGTESNNMAVKGAADAYKGRGRHIITSSVEHASVFEACKQLEAEGYRVTYLPSDETGAVRISDLEAAITDETVLVSLMLVNNETGRIQPVEEAGRLLRAYPKIIFHVDAVQGLGKLNVKPKEWRVDLMSFSAHKFRGPKGTGFLYRREGVNLVPLLAGGGQEFGLRSGTENVPMLVGTAKAVRMAVEAQPKAEAHMYELRRRLVDKLLRIEGVLVNGSEREKDMAPHVVHFSCPGVKPEVLVHTLEEKGIYISTRSACASGDNRPSRVLQAMGLAPERAASGLRVSYSPEQTAGEIDYFAAKLEEALSGIVRISQGG